MTIFLSIQCHTGQLPLLYNTQNCAWECRCWLTAHCVLARSYHKMDLMNESGYVYLTNKFVQVKNHFRITSPAGTTTTTATNLTALPPINSTTATAFYNKTLQPDTWWYGNQTYNHTEFTVLLPGPSNG